MQKIKVIVSNPSFLANHWISVNNSQDFDLMAKEVFKTIALLCHSLEKLIETRLLCKRWTEG